MDLIANCQRAVDGAHAMIATVQPDELARPTPCAEWDVRALINHMIGTCQGIAGAVRAAASGSGGTPPFAQAGEADLVGGDPAVAYGRAAEAVMQAWRSPGALDRTVTLFADQVPAEMAARILVGDQTIHTWDLAKALGRPYTMDEELAASTLELMRQFDNPEMRGPGRMFAAAVECPEDAPIQERLIALSGRRP